MFGILGSCWRAISFNRFTYPQLVQCEVVCSLMHLKFISFSWFTVFHHCFAIEQLWGVFLNSSMFPLNVKWSGVPKCTSTFCYSVRGFITTVLDRGITWWMSACLTDSEIQVCCNVNGVSLMFWRFVTLWVTNNWNSSTCLLEAMWREYPQMHLQHLITCSLQERVNICCLSSALCKGSQWGCCGCWDHTVGEQW